MATLNKATGKYEARKLFKSTNEEFVGQGDSKEAAKKDLAAQLKPLEIDYKKGLKEQGLSDGEVVTRLAEIKGLVNSGKLPRYAPPLGSTGETSKTSPGFAVQADGNGRLSYGFNPSRTIPVHARPGLAMEMRGARMAKKDEAQSAGEKK